jgi:hypothetical protein
VHRNSEEGEQLMRRIVITSGLIAIALLIAVAAPGNVTTPAQAQVSTTTSTPITTTPQIDATVTPAATERIPPSPTAPAIEPLTKKMFDDIGFKGYSLNSIAVDADDNVYVPDANRYIHVFNRDFEEFRRIPVPQAVAVAFNRARDVLLVGRQYPATIEQLTPEGNSLGTLWTTPNTILDCIGVDQKDMIYAIFTGVNAPFARSMVKLDPKGNIIFLREMSPTTLDEDIVYGITFQTDGTLNITASGYGRDPVLLSFWEYSPAGDRLLGRPRAFFSSLLLRSPGYPLRLPDGKLVMYNGDGLGWWTREGTPLSFTFWTETVGIGTRANGKHGGIALSTDGKTVFYADITDTDKLVLGRTRLAGS